MTQKPLIDAGNVNESLGIIIVKVTLKTIETECVPMVFRLLT